MNDDKVHIDVELPCLPHKGDILYITKGQRYSLLQQARKTLGIASRYAPKWFYCGSSGCEHPMPKDLKNMSFSDAIIVNHISFDTSEDFVRIELSDGEEEI
jgi:hypothetical protein